MNELIFFAVIILFTIIEAISKARKKRAEGAEGGEGGEEAGGEVSDRERLARRSGPHEREDEPSETMIPADIWEEIAGLGQGRREPEPEPEPTEWAPAPQPTPAPRPKPAPAPTPSYESESPRGYTPLPKTHRTPAPTLSRIPATKEMEHRMHRLHPELGTDPSERTPSEQDWRPEARQNRNAKRVRAMLRGSEGTDALKQAFILREVLGPPTAMKDD
ncbi:MAG: hypothetical protein WD995_00515 [Gemmatimonadota bacterium]